MLGALGRPIVSLNCWHLLVLLCLGFYVVKRSGTGGLETHQRATAGAESQAASTLIGVLAEEGPSAPGSMGRKEGEAEEAEEAQEGEGAEARRLEKESVVEQRSREAHRESSSRGGKRGGEREREGERALWESCRVETMGGREKDGYGAWSVCGDQLKAGGVVYSFGIGGDVSFDAAVIDKGLEVFGFDPTIDEAKVQRAFEESGNRSSIPKKFAFRQIGLGNTDGVVTFAQSKNPRIGSKTAVGLKGLSVDYKDVGFQAAVLRLRTIMCMLGHSWLAVLKMDVEGLEFDVCLSQDFKAMPIFTNQILVEFHDRMVKDGKAKRLECLNVLKGKGYALVHASANGQELAFARLSPTAHVSKAAPAPV